MLVFLAPVLSPTCTVSFKCEGSTLFAPVKVCSFVPCKFLFTFLAFWEDSAVLVADVACTLASEATDDTESLLAASGDFRFFFRCKGTASSSSDRGSAVVTGSLFEAPRACLRFFFFFRGSSIDSEPPSFPAEDESTDENNGRALRDGFRFFLRDTRCRYCRFRISLRAAGAIAVIPRIGLMDFCSRFLRLPLLTLSFALHWHRALLHQSLHLHKIDEIISTWLR
mmetsp:Transcript_61763/g.145578  ORF Transcript_61763/g.145578 Transcript_61763/m.145578 type:complete len:225 (-) Transcript_61763:57-731(-)